MVHAEHSAEQHGHHIVPFKTLLVIFLALIALTVITVITAQFNLGALNVPLAIAIATTKAALVVMFFMALKYDRPVNTLVFVIGIVFVLIFLTFTWFDTGFRGDLGNVDSMTIQDRARMEEQMRAREAQFGGAVAPVDTAAQVVDTTAAGADTSAAEMNVSAGSSTATPAPESEAQATE